MTTEESLPMGEIIPAIYCPRCGNTFTSQSDMVIHLRGHLFETINDSKQGQRGRGRPRKHPGKVITYLFKFKLIRVCSLFGRYF